MTKEHMKKQLTSFVIRKNNLKAQWDIAIHALNMTQILRNQHHQMLVRIQSEQNSRLGLAMQENSPNTENKTIWQSLQSQTDLSPTL